MDNTQLYTEILQRNKKMLSDSTRLGTVRKAKAAGELIQMRPGMTGGALCFTYFNHWSFNRRTVHRTCKDFSHRRRNCRSGLRSI